MTPEERALVIRLLSHADIAVNALKCASLPPDEMDERDESVSEAKGACREIIALARQALAIGGGKCEIPDCNHAARYCYTHSG